MTPFDGVTYDRALDGVRLGDQLAAVKSAMVPGRWWTLHELSVALGYPEASISARIRDLRKAKFGGFTVSRARVAGKPGLYAYRVEVP